MAKRLIHAKRLAAKLGYDNERSLWPALPRLEAKGFPRRIKITERTVRWDEDDVDAWLDERKEVA
ncbi:MAG: AlpA family phage regulatory protein [Azospirillaceae bacterium]